MHKISYSKGIREIGNIIKKTKIVPNTINVGGGFPSVYPDLNPEPLINYMEEIKKEVNNLKLNKLPEIICEPGRALVAESGSTIVKVILRKKIACTLMTEHMDLYLTLGHQTLFYHQR